MGFDTVAFHNFLTVCSIKSVFNMTVRGFICLPDNRCSYTFGVHLWSGNELRGRCIAGNFRLKGTGITDNTVSAGIQGTHNILVAAAGLQIAKYNRM